MNGYQSSTLALVGSLALVTLWHNQTLQSAWSVLSTNQNMGRVDLSADAKIIGIDLLGVAVLTFVAGLSDDAGKMTIAVAAALWLLFLMSHASSGASSNPFSGAWQAALNAAQQVKLKG